MRKRVFCKENIRFGKSGRFGERRKGKKNGEKREKFREGKIIFYKNFSGSGNMNFYKKKSFSFSWMLTF